jgi:hypothetical protein
MNDGAICQFLDIILNDLLISAGENILLIKNYTGALGAVYCKVVLFSGSTQHGS